jgi:hypothetical protein
MDTRRLLLFVFGCIGSRAALTYLAYIASPSTLRYMGIAAALVAIGFTAIYLFDLRPTGPEVFGERIWWNNMRPVHAALYALFAFAAYTGERSAWTFLAADTAIGLGAFLHHHFA